jgi:hypothetical protein
LVLLLHVLQLQVLMREHLLLRQLVLLLLVVLVHRLCLLQRERLLHRLGPLLLGSLPIRPAVLAQDAKTKPAAKAKANLNAPVEPAVEVQRVIMTRGRRTEETRTEELAKLIIDIEMLQKRKAEIEKEALHNQPAKRGKKGG